MEPNQMSFAKKPFRVRTYSDSVLTSFKRLSVFKRVIIIILVLAFVFVVFKIIFRSSAANDLLTNFCNSLTNNDYTTAYNDTSNQYQHKVSAVQFIALAEGGRNQGYSNCSLSNVQEDDSSGTGSGTITAALGNASTEVVTALLVNDNGTWKINNLIFPTKPPSS